MRGTTRRRVAVLGTVACGLQLALPASALQVLKGGTDGGPAQDGGDAVAVAISADPSNSAVAFGGTGGTPGLVPTSGGGASATAETQVSGEASAGASASGGRGGDGLGAVAAGPGGAAQASAVAENTSAESVTVAANATGGHGGELAQQGGAGGQASLGRVYGASSGGGDVRVQATLTGGDGGTGGLAGAGASVALQNAVDGETSGALYLGQRAVGGDPGFGLSPTAGSAESSLTAEKSAASLELVSEAFAGERLVAFPGVVFLGSGADATAIAEGSNSSGSATTRAMAVAGAGRGNDSGTPPGVGGEANLRATATTLGDGHAVRVGEAPIPNPPFPPEIQTGAVGGAGGPAPVFPAIAPGRGGDARSLSIGAALGDSTVYVFDHAIGGRGGGCMLLFGGCPLAGGGGDASSEAIGEGAGHSSVEVHALAVGGQGGMPGEDSPRGGASVASAAASGLGEVHATAEAGGSNQVGGFFFLSTRPIALSGDASALATGLGSSGSAEAIAAARGGVMDRMALYAGASIATGASAEAQASAARSFSASDSPTTSDVLVRATAAPLPEDSQQVLEDNPGIEAAFAAAGVDEMLALGRIQMRSSQLAGTDSILLSGAASFDVLAALVAVGELPRPGNVWVSFFAPELGGDGFESLRVRLARNDVDVLDLLFTDPEDARSALDQLVFDLGAIRDPAPPEGDPQPPLLGTGNFTIDFDLRVRDVDDSFGVGFLVGSTPIPEPSTLLLVGSGLAVLAFRRLRA